MIPRATYRVQFHKDFPFHAAIPLVPYWTELGISHVYASPIGTARAGSNHGYDVIDPTRINPELGGEEGFRALAAALKAEGLGIILDIVPNHVAVGQGDNGWWLDVLEKGEASPYADFFDIDWRSPDPALDGKLIAPFLGAPYAEVLASGELKLEQRGGRLAVVAYGTHVFPLRREDQQALAEADLARFADADALHELCEHQHWRLAWWRAAGDLINWRRFFDITELAGLRIEREEVFQAVHALPLSLYSEGLIDGVRVDHIDGLADPTAYCRRLRSALDEAGKSRPDNAAPGPAYIVVEKILASDEHLPPDWPVDGTSGYDFLGQVCALIHDDRAAKPLARLWHQLSGRPPEFHTEEYAARRMMLERNFAAQWDATAGAFARLAASILETRDIGQPAWRRTIGWLLEGFTAYRTYGTGDAAPASDADIRRRAVSTAMTIAGPAEAQIIRRIDAWLSGDGPGHPSLRHDAVRRFQQLSAPIAAKSVEDTAFYRYGRLLSRNDVGCDPSSFSLSSQAFADAVLARSRRFPHAMLTTATHDHKRGEDVRARLAVLSEIPTRWCELANRWAGTVPHRVDCGDAHMLHQTIVGAWPIDLAPDDEEGVGLFTERLADWQIKALREAKLTTSWACPDEGYEQQCREYLRQIMSPGSDFLREAADFAFEIAPAGWAKSLVQTLLRYTLPGVPDLYQGCELWDQSLVDPDNRRPVDYAKRIGLLRRSDGAWPTGSSKQTLIRDLLEWRRRLPDLFQHDDTHFCRLEGAQSGNAIAFERHASERRMVVVAATRCSRSCIERREPAPSRDWWGDTKIKLSNGDSIPAVELTANEAFGFRIQ
jgi:(1->4)-alpha-D-glucan 1-alpha-D-glucosylmutase